jgi:hypothetical protein
VLGASVLYKHENWKKMERGTHAIGCKRWVENIIYS